MSQQLQFTITGDLAPLEREVDNVINRVQNKLGLMTSRTLGLISTIASATGTTLGKQISLVISGAMTSYQLMQQIATSQLSNPYTAIFGALTLAQIAFLWTSIFQAIGEKEQISSAFSSITASLTTLIGTVSYR